MLSHTTLKCCCAYTLNCAHYAPCVPPFPSTYRQLCKLMSFRAGDVLQGGCMRHTEPFKIYRNLLL